MHISHSKKIIFYLFFLLYRLPWGSGDLDYSFCTLPKIVNTTNPYSITLTFGTDKQHNNKVNNTHTKFHTKSINIQDVFHE